MKPLPVFSVERDTVVTHIGALAGQWRWMLLVGERDKHWWNERIWWSR